MFEIANTVDAVSGGGGAGAGPGDTERGPVLHADSGRGQQGAGLRCRHTLLHAASASVGDRHVQLEHEQVVRRGHAHRLRHLLLRRRRPRDRPFHLYHTDQVQSSVTTPPISRFCLLYSACSGILTIHHFLLSTTSVRSISRLIIIITKNCSVLCCFSIISFVIYLTKLFAKMEN